MGTSVEFDAIVSGHPREMQEMFIKFITGQGAIAVKNERDFRNFIDLLVHHNVLFILNDPGKYRHYDEWVYLAIINNKKHDVFCFEYQPGKGLSWYDNVEEPTEWYGEPPMVIPEPEMPW